MIVLIREYNDSDIPFITFLGRGIDNNFSFKLNNVSKCFVYDDLSIIGFIIADIYDDRAEIIDVAVNVNDRKKGIGSKLLEYVINLCKEKGCKSITLEVKYNNVPAIELYKKYDFKVISVRKKYYENGTIDAHLMFREL